LLCLPFDQLAFTVNLILLSLNLLVNELNLKEKKESGYNNNNNHALQSEKEGVQQQQQHHETDRGLRIVET
jgi:hypothetical protein